MTYFDRLFRCCHKTAKSVVFKHCTMKMCGGVAAQP